MIFHAGGDSRFQRWRFWFPEILGRCPRLQFEDAPLALTHTDPGYDVFGCGISSFTGALLAENLGAVNGSFSSFQKILETLPEKSRRREEGGRSFARLAGVRNESRVCV
jgi:hypothetical protein